MQIDIRYYYMPTHPHLDNIIIKNNQAIIGKQICQWRDMIVQALYKLKNESVAMSQQLLDFSYFSMSHAHLDSDYFILVAGSVATWWSSNDCFWYSKPESVVKSQW